MPFTRASEGLRTRLRSGKQNNINETLCQGDVVQSFAAIKKTEISVRAYPKLHVVQKAICPAGCQSINMVRAATFKNRSAKGEDGTGETLKGRMKWKLGERHPESRRDRCGGGGHDHMG